MEDKTDLESYTQKYQQLMQGHKTLLLSSVSQLTEPECSYAPFVRDKQGVFYVYVSELASHTQNMLTTAKASVMFIQAENQTTNLFARERAVFNCTVIEIENADDCFEKMLQKLKQQCGDTVDLLRSLPDFHLLALKPVSGKYIAGFGKAFSINISNDTLK